MAISQDTAYGFGQLLDILVFSKVRSAVNDDGLKIGSYWYAAPIISTFFDLRLSIFF